VVRVAFFKTNKKVDEKKRNKQGGKFTNNKGGKKNVKWNE